MEMDNCPIRKEAEKVMGLGTEMLKALRRLRRSMAKCEICPHQVGCPLRQEFNEMIDGIITELNEQWGLR